MINFYPFPDIQDIRKHIRKCFSVSKSDPCDNSLQTATVIFICNADKFTTLSFLDPCSLAALQKALKKKFNC